MKPRPEAEEVVQEEILPAFNRFFFPPKIGFNFLAAHC